MKVVLKGPATSFLLRESNQGAHTYTHTYTKLSKRKWDLHTPVKENHNPGQFVRNAYINEITERVYVKRELKNHLTVASYLLFIYLAATLDNIKLLDAVYNLHHRNVCSFHDLPFLFIQSVLD